MRRIRKPKPPRNVSPDGQAPCSMLQAERDFLASLPGAPDPAKRARTRFDALDKQKLREVLCQEQRHICVYCQRQLRGCRRGAGEAERHPSKEVEDPPIEHWRPLSEYPDKALCWSNLYLSCPTPGTCDDAKRGERLVWDEADPGPGLPWPTEVPYHDWIGYTALGDAYVRADAPIDEPTRKALERALDDAAGGKPKSTLYLNHRRLKAARQAAIEAEQDRMAKDFGDRHASEDERRARADAMLREAVYPSFVSARVAYLRRMLGKNKPPRP